MSFNRKKKHFAAVCEQLIDNMYQQGCPCEYERFRDYYTMEPPGRFC